MCLPASHVYFSGDSVIPTLSILRPLWSITWNITSPSDCVPQRVKAISPTSVIDFPALFTCTRELSMAVSSMC